MPIEKNPTEARQGVKLGVVRWVLFISLSLIVLAFILAYALTPV